ncbi:unnamed protein product [Rhodiola kirilowii]
MRGFEVSCGTDGEILYQANFYRIEKIDYLKQQLNVVNVRFLDLRDTCEAPERNLTLRGVLFDFVPNQNDSLYLYTCPNSSIPKTLAPYEFHCSTENDASEKTFVAMFGDDLNLGDAVKECGRAVSTTVELQANARRFNGSSVAGDWDYYEEVLRRGFWLEWKATNCTECASSGGRCGFDEDDYRFWCYCPDRPHSQWCRSGWSNKVRNIIIIIVSTVCFVILTISIFIYLRLRKRKEKLDCVDEIGSADTLQLDFGTIRTATNNFSDDNKLGQGGFGSVYKGKLADGQEIAVKRLATGSRQGDLEFKNEVVLVAKLQHRNLVRLLGFCSKGQERLLIYKFVANASLDQFLFDPSKRSYLNWERRNKIIGGVARGLLYLHEDSRLRIIHRDLKASNVLLDEEMQPKIADFGMARLCIMDQTQDNTNRIVGTYGYMAPEYAMHGQFSVKSDVYSFGVLLLELVTGQKNNCFRVGQTVEDLISFAWDGWRAGSVANMIDLVIISGPRNEILRCIHIGLLCVQESVTARPTMTSVVTMLNSFLVALPPPSEPAFYLHMEAERPMLAGSSNSKCIFSNFSKNEVSITEMEPR